MTHWWRRCVGKDRPAAYDPDLFLVAPDGTWLYSKEAWPGASCGSCHQINGRGGHLGPDLSHIGSARQRDMLTRDIRDASAAMRPGYRPVTLITKDGRRIRGTKKSEDAFSIQIMDTSEQLRGVVKTDVKEIMTDSRSLMPDFPATRLGDQDLEDLLAFLGSLRSPTNRP